MVVSTQTSCGIPYMTIKYFPSVPLGEVTEHDAISVSLAQLC